MIYRSRTEIVFRILRGAEPGATKTKIMHGASSYEQLQDYIPFLVKNEMVHRDEATQIYKLTSRGQRFMEACGPLLEMIGIDSQDRFPGGEEADPLAQAEEARPIQS